MGLMGGLRVGPLRMKPAYLESLNPVENVGVLTGTYGVVANHIWTSNAGIVIRSVEVQLEFAAAVGSGVSLVLAGWDPDVGASFWTDPSFNVLATVPVTAGATVASALWTGTYVIPAYGNVSGSAAFTWLVRNESGSTVVVPFAFDATHFLRYLYTA